MSDNGMTLEELRQRDDVQDLLDKLEHGIRSRYGISRALSDLGIPPDMVEQLIGVESVPGSDPQPESQIDQYNFRKPVTPNITAFQKLRVFKMHSTLTWLLVYFLLFNLMTALLTLYGDLNERSVLTSLRDDPFSVTIAEAESSDDLQELISVITFLVYLPTIFIFLRWFWVSYKNAEAFNAYNIRFGPHWTWLGFVIPILNIWRPWQVAKEIWKASNPFVDVSQNDGWRYEDASNIIHIWWIVFFLVNRGSQAYLRQSFAENPNIDELISQNTVGIALDIGTMLSAILAAAFVYQLSARQWEKYEQLTKEQFDMAP